MAQDLGKEFDHTYFFSFPRESRKKEFDECSMYVVSLYCEIFNVEQQYAYVLQ